MDNRKFIFVTGFFGAPLEEIAGRLAEDEGAELISLDEEISREALKRYDTLNGGN